MQGDGLGHRRNSVRIFDSPRARASENHLSDYTSESRQPSAFSYRLKVCLEDDDTRVFLLALRDVAEARGGIRSLSRDAHLNRESLYRMLSKSGNPSLDSLSAVLNACGLRLAVQSGRVVGQFDFRAPVSAGRPESLSERRFCGISIESLGTGVERRWKRWKRALAL